MVSVEDKVTVFSVVTKNKFTVGDLFVCEDHLHQIKDTWREQGLINPGNFGYLSINGGDPAVTHDNEASWCVTCSIPCTAA